ncbi:uncharacterized protein LOC9636910 [Selaginella moellendorffii]|nr:uncharacterized protein LOC9636910 [Selaginella moellendorffii]|eukprot:XP_002974884.2 uncharacterized protein LOC9636910 [Selaginella moellendorffii]
MEETSDRRQATIRARNRGAASRSATIATISSRLFLAIVLFQLPLFRVPCQAGVCTNPLELTAVQMAGSKATPLWLVKSLLLPGACVRGLITDLSLPSWDKILEQYNITETNSPGLDLLRLEVIAGSYFAVAGALVGVFKHGRMSMFGMLLIAWGLIKEGILHKNPSSGSQVHANPAFIVAVALGFLSVKYDFQKVQTLARPVVNPLKSSAKSKLK